ncbi:MAG: transglycosylase domain-containing protein [Bacteroidales bacterium]
MSFFSKQGIQALSQRIYSFLQFRNKPWYNKTLRIIALLICTPILYLVLVYTNPAHIFGYMPSLEEIQNPQQDIASEIYTSDGHLLGKFFLKNRSIAQYKDIPETLIQTLIATEDARFYLHDGVDFKSMPQLILDALKGHPRGGSTITQQLIKNLYNTRSKSNGIFDSIPYIRMLIIKTKEWISALTFEKHYTKKEILALYLNTVDYGSHSFGIRTASRTFFNKTPQELNKPECALLIGILNAPSAYSPIQNPKQALKRRNIILKIMKRDHIISNKEYTQFISQPIQLKYNIKKTYEKTANYFRQAALKEIVPWLQSHDYNIYTDGLKIHTSLNYTLQQYAENAVKKHVKQLQKKFDIHWKDAEPWENNPDFINKVIKRTSYYKKLTQQYTNKDSINYYIHKKEPRTLFSWNGTIDTVISLYDATAYTKKLLHSAFIALDPHSGGILAYVGGINHTHFKFDNCTSQRQPGSTFKAFVYGAALENGWSPCDSIQDSLFSVHYTEKGIHKTWTPHNANWEYLDTNITLKHGFARSLNTVTVRLADSLGIEKIIAFAHKLGINSDLDTVPSVCLGTSEVNIQELTAAYCPLINNGYKISPYFVTHIENYKGQRIAEFTHTREQVIDTSTAFLMQQLFLGTLTEPHATTAALLQYDIFAQNTIDYGGKTGTSANYSDGWFIGISPNIVAGTWVGAQERMVHFRTSQLGEGGKTALPIFGLFMEQVIKDSSFNYLHETFPRKMPKIERTYDCHTTYYDLYEEDSTKSDSTIIDSVNLDSI